MSYDLSADRMVREYVQRLYVPAAAAERVISADDYARARALAAWKAKVIAAWPRVSVAHVESGGVDAVPQVGDELRVRAHVNLDGLTIDDVSVEVVYGRARENDQLENPESVTLRPLRADGDLTEFAASVTLSSAGSFGYNVRVVPKHPLLASPAELGLIAVAG
jgi:starch phosphorylase